VWLHFQTFFRSEVRFHGFLTSFLAHIASDSSVIDILGTSNLPRRYPQKKVIGVKQVMVTSLLRLL
jgi:hypothetical protein